MTIGRIVRFAEGNVDAARAGTALDGRFPGIINQLNDLGLTGNLFMKYYEQVGYSPEDVDKGLRDGSARRWLIAHHKRMVKQWHNDPSPVAIGLRDLALQRFARDDPSGARKLADQLGLPHP